MSVLQFVTAITLSLIAVTVAHDMGRKNAEFATPAAAQKECAPPENALIAD